MKKKNIRQQIEFYKRNNGAKKLAKAAAGAFAAGLACLALSDRIRALRKTAAPVVKVPPGGIITERPTSGEFKGFNPITGSDDVVKWRYEERPGDLDLFGEVSIAASIPPVKWERLPPVSNEERVSYPIKPEGSENGN